MEEQWQIKPKDVPEHMDVETAFLDWVEVWPQGWENLNILAADVNGNNLTLHDILNELEGSRDIMPSGGCDCVDLPQGFTYGDAVKKIKHSLGLS